MSTSKKSLNDLFVAELYLYFHKDFLTDERTERECDFVVEQGGLPNKGRVLDLACGHGRHANYFAQMGYQVTGIDMNTRFIEIAKEEADKKDLAVEYIEGDILEIDFKDQFDVVYCLYNTIGFLDHADNLKLLARVYQALKPGGRFIIDTKNRDHILMELVPSSITEKNEDLMIDRVSFDSRTGMTLNNRIYIKDGKRYDTPFAMYTYHFNDLAAMAESSHFHLVHTFGSWSGANFDHHSRRIIMVLKKD